MPNWCYNYITINGDGKDLKKFNALLEDWTKECSHENDFDEGWWLGNIAEKGLGVDPMKTNILVRGTLEYLEYNEDEEQMILTTSSAWRPSVEMWDLLVRKYIPDSEVVYNSVEESNGIWVTNDPALVGTYFKDFYADSSKPDPFDGMCDAPEDDVRRRASEIEGIDSTLPIEELLSALDEGGFPLRKWERVEIDEMRSEDGLKVLSAIRSIPEAPLAEGGAYGTV